MYFVDRWSFLNYKFAKWWVISAIGLKGSYVLRNRNRTQQMLWFTFKLRVLIRSQLGTVEFNHLFFVFSCSQSVFSVTTAFSDFAKLSFCRYLDSNIFASSSNIGLADILTATTKSNYPSPPIRTKALTVYYTMTCSDVYVVWIF